MKYFAEQGDFVLDDPLSATLPVSPFVVLCTLKQRRLENLRQAEAEIRDNTPRHSPTRSSSNDSGNG
ncbi:hypothetical protein [Pantoea sp. SGAir0183]